METAKEQVQRILEALPEDASLEDIQYHIYVLQKIDHGLADGEAGRVISHEEAMSRLDKWRPIFGSAARLDRRVR
jgi:predicted transcriptional regulator